ncbi:MAG TPA: cytochrome c oxidase assembly protein [Thermoleophilaceae bacterium]|nr:cytochrome c oxidase assembly protein [Thermoleophilaceae bacterium]
MTPLASPPLHLAEALPPLFVCAGYLITYRARARTLARQGRAVARWRYASFAAGVCILTLVQLPPLDELADTVLIAHVVQHIAIGDIASFLVVAGVTGPVLQPLLHVRATRWLRPLAHPVTALLLWALNYYVWHLPALYQAGIRHDAVHALEHASYFWFGMLLWLALLGPMPKPGWFGNWARLGYVALVRFAGAVLANAFIWAGTVFYPYYDGRDVRYGLKPLSDQNVAGAIMMIEQIILTTLLLAWLFGRAARQDEERQELLDLAEKRGVALSDARAARAAASGGAARMRERLLNQDSKRS